MLVIRLTINSYCWMIFSQFSDDEQSFTSDNPMTVNSQPEMSQIRRLTDN